MNLFLIFQYGLIGAFVVLLATFVLVMASERVEGYVSPLFGLDAKNDTLTFLGIGMGGVLLALQALMAYKRAKALEDTANAQAKAANAQADAAKAQAAATKEQAKANQNTEQGQRQERLKNAIEHLGHDKDSVRLGGAYELFHLAEDTKELRQTILDILCAHIRRTTGESEYREKYKLKPSEEIQSLLTLLFMQDHEVFKRLYINLQESWLNGANLANARLQGANLWAAYLQKAHLGKAQLQRAGLSNAYLQGADLDHAHLQGASLVAAHLQESSLSHALLQGAIFYLAELQCANLNSAQLQGAIFATVRMQGADLGGAQMQGAVLDEAWLQEASLFRAQLQGVGSRLKVPAPPPFAQRINQATSIESNLSGMTFTGGIDREDIDFFVEGLSDEKASQLREKLEHHIDQPSSSQATERTGFLVGRYTKGTYTKEEAERWIAEYEKAMSEVPGDND